jgi:thiosulfate/3-mercaptopyruvate sulfurtransferase
MTQTQLPSDLVSVDWLQQNLQHDNLLLFDASWHMPATGRDGYLEWQQERIPGARFFDFDRKICDPASPLPHMLPSEQDFTRELQALGLSQDSCVVIYDSMGMFSAPRAWWMLRVMGCDRVALLDGGLPAWKSAGFAVEGGSDLAEYPLGNFGARLDVAQVADAVSVLAALDDADSCVLDARPQARFQGLEDEPRAGLRRGHMPGALNLPFALLFEQGLLKSEADISKIVEPLIGNSQQFICTCGSGVTACILAFALHRIGIDRVAVYDGSWSDWGLPGELPVVSEAR